jgi:Gpi18-like mannosyltransferase
MKNKVLLFWLIVATALVFRLYLSDKGWHVDLWSNAAWGEWIYTNGPVNFYKNSVWIYSWPTQPPLINTIYALDKKAYIELLGRLAGLNFQLGKIQVYWLSDFVHWFGYGKINLEIPFQTGYLVTIKLLPILADLVIAGILYFWSKKKIWWPIIYLASPFSWYLSAGWGQYDGVGFCLALLGFLSVFSPFGIIGPALLTLAVLIKPTSLILLPFFLYVFLRKKGNVLGLLIPIIIFMVTTQPYTRDNVFKFARHDLTRIIFQKTEPRLTVNSFNFWRIWIGNGTYPDKYPALSLFIFGIFNLAGIINFEIKQKNIQALWESLFTVSMGAFLFMTGMLERYAFAGIVTGLFMVTNRPKLIKYWLGMSLIFWMNLYYHWWWPEWMIPVRYILTWNSDVVTRLLSVIQIILFAKLLPGNFRILPFPLIQKQKKPV